MAPRRHRGKSRASRGILKAAVYGVVAGAVGAFGLHLTKATPQRPTLAGIDHRLAVLVTPEGNGSCRRVTVSNDGPMIDARSVPCASLTTGRAELPPVLRGYQATLRNP
jgi:hypothetical protein